ncbi:N-terminal domain of peptidoglycan hydrolase CwlO-containing protein [Geodermatophilus saharensis]|uniref:N-terminal domain of peptidoglycan hydrolase CwlO-containing protein n=1 Tax=Geodermatophilus saharensis TaxID=1137994 RepID=A0A239BKY4_9ACTN|nr:D-alanyl-D-alanine carboxypeptidase family protein [Geodermatophilus saharensis]SNS07684.1 N-terminal domain of peptidoglycan hydrolase CwlO-containing protein [Geodermatophilus saharensis]
MRLWSRSRTLRRAAPLALVTAAVLVALPLAGPAAATPSDQPGGTSGVLDSEALDRLQQRAAEVQADLRQRQTEVAAAQQALADAQADVDAARAAVTAAEEELARHQDDVARYASAAYRDGGTLSPLSVLLSGGDPGDLAAALGYLDAVDDHAAAVVTAAERQRRTAVAEQATADAALAEAQQRTDALGAQVRDLEAAADAVTGELDAALSDVDRQLSDLQQQQLDVNRQTAANWRAYLDQLAAAGVAPPPAADLLDPAGALPPGLVPVGSAAGAAQRGAAQFPREPTSLLVLPAETVAAVTAAMDALGRPYAPGTAGPDSWDCGSLVSTVYGRAGVPLPADQAGLFAVTVPVDLADVLPGDLVFLGTPESGLGHVGIALDRDTMLAADARAGAVVVRRLPADEVLHVGRPSLGTRPEVPAPGPSDGALRVECGNTVYPPSSVEGRSWGGYPNGLIPPSALCPLGVGGHSLRCDAAAAYRAMSGAFAAQFGEPICITDSYRTYAGQVRLYGEKPALAAVPGTSNHGWGLAVDLCGGIQTFGTAQYAWMVANAGRFGWLHPTWADPGNGREEPWHWEYAGS